MLHTGVDALEKNKFSSDHLEVGGQAGTRLLSTDLDRLLRYCSGGLREPGYQSDAANLNAVVWMAVEATGATLSAGTAAKGHTFWTKRNGTTTATVRASVAWVNNEGVIFSLKE